MAFSVACHSGGVSSGFPASSHRTYARMSTRSFGISTSAADDRARVSRSGDVCVPAGAVEDAAISMEGTNGSASARAEDGTGCSTGAGGVAAAAAATRAARSASAAAAAAARASLSSCAALSASVLASGSVWICTTLLCVCACVEKSMTTGSSSPGTTGWLYRRRMSFRVTPRATSVCRSRRAWAYSVACHSGEVSSGMPAFSHRTYARMPTRSSGISTRETSMSGTRSPTGSGGKGRQRD